MICPILQAGVATLSLRRETPTGPKTTSTEIIDVRHSITAHCLGMECAWWNANTSGCAVRAIPELLISLLGTKTRLTTLTPP